MPKVIHPSKEDAICTKRSDPAASDLSGKKNGWLQVFAHAMLRKSRVSQLLSTIHVIFIKLQALMHSPKMLH